VTVVTGGQLVESGVDRGALDAALAVDFPCGGWCPGESPKSLMAHPSEPSWNFIRLNRLHQIRSCSESATSYIFGNRIERIIQRAHFIRSALSFT